MNTLLRLLISIILIAGNQINAQESAPHKIVMQLTSNDTLVHSGLIKQLNNLKSGWGDSVAIEVVCHGPGIEFLKKGNVRNVNQINSLINKSVRFVACENTLRAKKIEKNELMPNLDFVVMGIAEIVEKQEKGWAYIKAGF